MFSSLKVKKKKILTADKSLPPKTLNPMQSREEQRVADSSTRKAILTNRKGKQIASNRTTGKNVRLENRRLAAAEDPLPEPELGMVTFFIPAEDM